MKKITGILLLITSLGALPVIAEPTASPAAPMVPTPAQSKPGAPASPAPSGIVFPAAPVASSGQLLEERRQQELVANAERIDKANRDLLAQNQQLQLMNENQGIQIKVLQGDRSAEGIRNGALAVLAGLAAGWFIFRGGRKKGSW